VYFRFTISVTGNRRAFKFKSNINSYSNKKERLKEANSLVYVLHDKLKSGSNPILVTLPSELWKILVKKGWKV